MSPLKKKPDVPVQIFCVVNLNPNMDPDLDPHGFALTLAPLDLEPDHYWECGSGSRSRNDEIHKNLQINLISSL